VRIVLKLGKSGKTVLNEILIRQNVGRPQFAKVMGVHESLVSRWIHRDRGVKPRHRIKIQKLTGLTHDELFELDSRKENPDGN
jgi:plasmid maintenance system antidote protein VapI